MLKKMTLYHGSDTAIHVPRILPPSRLLDFGEGFYTTSSYEQAKSWAQRVRMRRNSKNEIISIFEFDMPKAVKTLQIIKFDSPTPEWLRFVAACRSGKETGWNYDIAIGPVANDNVYATIQLFETGLLSEAETITRLKVEKLYDQILFHTENALKLLSFVKIENLSEDPNG